MLFRSFRAVVGPVTAVAAVLGGWLAGSWGGNSLFGQFDASGLKLIFLISFVGRIASLALLAGVREPDAVSLRYIVRVYRRYFRLRRPASIPVTLELPQPQPSIEPVRLAEELPDDLFRAA